VAEPLSHFARALEELLLGVLASTRSLASLRRALRAEEQRWAARAGDDPAAERVREIFAALADVLEPPSKSGRRPKFDPPRERWDTRARWRS
jgi:hypothetical protein